MTYNQLQVTIQNSESHAPSAKDLENNSIKTKLRQRSMDADNSVYPGVE